MRFNVRTANIGKTCQTEASDLEKLLLWLVDGHGKAEFHWGMKSFEFKG